MFIFVYGTLKKGFPNSNFLANAKFVGEGRTVDKYPLVIASRFNIPYLLGLKNVGNQIAGEVYDVTESQLKALDRFEGYPDHYNRIEVPVCVDFKVVGCHTYVLDRYKDSLLQFEMLKVYSVDKCMSYVRACDRPAETKISFREEVMDYSK
jgi:gamma-glutamylaminecyclotransferase